MYALGCYQVKQLLELKDQCNRKVIIDLLRWVYPFKASWIHVGCNGLDKKEDLNLAKLATNRKLVHSIPQCPVAK